MGDKYRFRVFADFIAAMYPTEKYPRVLDVAGGGGYLALELVARGYAPVIIDPRRTWMNRRTRKHNRLAVSRLEESRRLEEFSADMAVDYDLVVGMHPDGATQEIVRAVEHAPVALVPCCNYWDGHDGDVVHACRAEFASLGVYCVETELDITGKNLILMGTS